MNRRATLLVGLVLLTACPPPSGLSPQSMPGVTSVVISGDYIHSKSGFVFPETFANFQRSAVNQFDPAGNNIGVGYDLNDGSHSISLTVYVRPPAQTTAGERLSLAKQFELEQAVIAHHHPDAEAGATWTPPQTANREPLAGHAVVYRYVGPISGQSQRLESLLYLFEYEGLIVKYRISYPAAQAEADKPIAEDFVARFLWKRAR